MITRKPLREKYQRWIVPRVIHRILLRQRNDPSESHVEDVGGISESKVRKSSQFVEGNQLYHSLERDAQMDCFAMIA